MGQDLVQGLPDAVPSGPGPQYVQKHPLEVGERTLHLPPHVITVLRLPLVPSDLQDTSHVVPSDHTAVAPDQTGIFRGMFLRDLCAVDVYAHPDPHSGIAVPILLGIVSRIRQENTLESPRIGDRKSNRYKSIVGKY